MKGKNKKTWTLDNLEVRTIQSDGQVDQPVIRGYAAVYNSESELLRYGSFQFREVIKPGAFDNSLSNDVRALWNHDSAYVLGRSTSGTLNIRSDNKGLYFEVSPPDTQWANDLCKSIQRGDINQMSFGFSVNQDSWSDGGDGTEMRELLDVDLQEVSVVTFPAYQATSAGMRSIEQEDETVKKRYEERTKEQPSEPDERFFDYLKIMLAYDSRSVEDIEEDPASDSDDPDNEDDSDDDEGDENEQAEKEPKTKK